MIAVLGAKEESRLRRATVRLSPRAGGSHAGAVTGRCSATVSILSASGGWRREAPRGGRERGGTRKGCLGIGYGEIKQMQSARRATLPSGCWVDGALLGSAGLGRNPRMGAGACGRLGRPLSARGGTGLVGVGEGAYVCGLRSISPFSPPPPCIPPVPHLLRPHSYTPSAAINIPSIPRHGRPILRPVLPPVRLL